MTNPANGVPLRHPPELTALPDSVPPRDAKAVVRADAVGADAAGRSGVDVSRSGSDAGLEGFAPGAWRRPMTRTFQALGRGHDDWARAERVDRLRHVAVTGTGGPDGPPVGPGLADLLFTGGTRRIGPETEPGTATPYGRSARLGDLAGHRAGHSVQTPARPAWEAPALPTNFRPPPAACARSPWPPGAPRSPLVATSRGATRIRP